MRPGPASSTGIASAQPIADDPEGRAVARAHERVALALVEPAMIHGHVLSPDEQRARPGRRRLDRLTVLGGAPGVVDGVADVEELMRRHQRQRQRHELLGRARPQIVERQRLGVGAVEELDARALEPRQLDQPRPLGAERLLRQKAGEPRADVAHRRVCRRAGDEVVGDEVVEGVVTDGGDDRAVVAAQDVEQPPEVHVGVDVEPLHGVEPRVAGDAARPSSSDFMSIRRNPSATPSGARDQLPEELLGFAQRGHAARSRVARSISAALRDSASTSSNGGMWSSHSTSVETRPKRATARR